MSYIVFNQNGTNKSIELLKPKVSNDCYGCFDYNVLIPIANFYEENLDPYFLSFYSLSFVSNHNININENRTLTLGNDYKYKILREFCGIDITREIIDNQENLVKRLCSEIENNNFVGISIDTFYCPWIESYQKLHIDHIILLTSFNKEKGFFTCIDYYNTEKIQRLKISEIENHLYRIYWIKKVKKKALFQYDSYKKILINSEKFVDGHDSNVCFDSFRQDILTYNYQFIERNSFEYDNFLIRLKRVECYRNLVADIIEKSFNTDDFDERTFFAQLLRKEANYWEALAKCLIKENYIKINLIEKIVNILKIIENYLKEEKIILGE